MGKFSKRIKKISQHVRYGLVIGSGFGNLEDLLENTATVFIVYAKDPEVRAKNLIYRENLESIYSLYEIDFVLIDADQVNLVRELAPLWKRNRCLLIIEGDPSSSSEQVKFLRKERFQVVDYTKKYHIWKMQ